ncbi:MAG: (Fe-S)-binding protein, partial [Bacteroidales bacterium]
ELEIKATLDRITQRNNNKEVNCGACGYGTCRGLATAIAQNIAIPEMCVTNAQLGNREVSHEFKMTMEELTMAKNDLKKTKESLKKNEQTLSFCNEALSILIKKLNTGIVLANEHLKVIECNIGFIDVLGDDVKEIHEVIPYLVGADLNTLLPTALITQLNYLLEHNEANINRDVEIDKKLINVSMFQLIPNKLVGALFRNLHSKEERPEEIIHRVNEIIEENLRQVQQMGFILGEGAAKMEKMLNSIIKSYK